jgi:hypothetical protein
MARRDPEEFAASTNGQAHTDFAERTDAAIVIRGDLPPKRTP